MGKENIIAKISYKDRKKKLKEKFTNRNSDKLSSIYLFENVCYNQLRVVKKKEEQYRLKIKITPEKINFLEKDSLNKRPLQRGIDS